MQDGMGRRARARRVGEIFTWVAALGIGALGAGCHSSRSELAASESDVIAPRVEGGESTPSALTGPLEAANDKRQLNLAKRAAPAPAPVAAMSPRPSGGSIGGMSLSRQQGIGAGGASLAATAGDSVGPTAAVPRIDPNARYSTTYRPGGAALAAFDTAVARGAIPAAYRDLVGDFGGRYAPALAKNENGSAMTFQVETERAASAPAGGAMNLRIAMRSSDAMPPRAPLSVHLVLDVSGSMQGEAIANARSAAEALVQRLAPTDDFSMVTFSSDATVLVPDGLVGPRRANILDKIHAVQADGGTNIGAGLDLAYAQAHTRSIDPGAVKIVMLLSDGHANGGDTNPESLAARSAHAFEDAVQTSSFGLGADFDAGLMSAIADRGAGGYYYLADSSQIGTALARELDARVVPAAQAVEVRVRLRPDVTPIKVFGSHVLDGAEAMQVRAQEVAVDRNVAKHDGITQDRKDDAAGGMRFFIPAFARDDRHAMMLTLLLPPGAGERALGSVEIRYKDRLRMRNVTEEIPVRFRYAADEAASAATRNASVAATAQAFAAGEAILAAASKVDAGDRYGATNALRERADLLTRAADALHEPALRDDAARLTELVHAVSGDDRVADAMPLAVLLRGSGYGYLR